MEVGFGGGDGDSVEDMATSPTSYLVVARGIKPRYYYQLSSSAGLYPSLLLWHVPGGNDRDLLVVARVKNPRYYYQLSSSEG